MRKIMFVVAGMFVAGTALGADPAIERAYKSKCASCHGADGKGKTKQGEKMKIRDMTAADWKKEFDDAKIKKAIEDGVARDKDGVKQEMKPLKDKLKPEEIDGLVKYVKDMK